MNQEFANTRERLVRQLLARRNASGHWEGQLSSSALSTATAAIALSLAGGEQQRVDHALEWLAATQNEDGGWGDTTLSVSNISTTALVWAAFSTAASHADVQARTEKWLRRAAGSLQPGALARAIIARYGNDRTFSVPILTTLAIAGRLGPAREGWGRVPQLPFELAAFPQRWFKWLRLPVVSYALPALIALGHARHRRRPTRNPLAGAVRNGTSSRTLNVLERLQPSSGGFLEAVPLTSFVAMSLLAAGEADHPVVQHGLEFLRRSARADGSWPIDTNLATWVTTLSVEALGGHECGATVLEWLLKQQYVTEHPYTLAAPGGWAWTDLPGGVPDADDTAGALLALRRLAGAEPDARTTAAARAGARWLLGLQNRDGGIPTFCRGWSKLPFDRSAPDLTAHAVRAWLAWRDAVPVDAAVQRALRYLESSQRPDGSWLPLWFGNQHAPDDENPAYGTSRVLLALAEPGAGAKQMRDRGVAWLLAAQNRDGGWGGAKGVPPSIEETALAVEALAAVRQGPELDRAIINGASWLVAATDEGRTAGPSPLGFYFAKLWYFEELYPLIFSVAALSRVCAALPAAQAIMAR